MHVWNIVAKRLELRRNERSSRAALEERQLRKLRRLAVHAARSSPYWAKIVESHGIDPARCRVTDFPLLTKQDLVANFDQCLTVKDVTRAALWDFMESTEDPSLLFKGRYVVMHSSGTSGRPVVHCCHVADWLKAATLAVRYDRPSLRKKRVAHFGRQGHSAGSKIAHSVRLGPLKHLYELLAIDSADPIEEVVRKLNGFQPELLGGYPSTVALLAEQQAKGALAIAPRRILCSGEQLTPVQSQEIKQAFQRRPRNLYLTSEHLLMAMDGPRFEGMYLMEDDLIFEFLDGRTVVTNLTNRTQPLIRYVSDDVLRPLEDRDRRWPFTKIATLEGRVTHNLVFRADDGELAPLDFHSISLLRLRFVRRFQMQQESEKAFVFRVVLGEGLSAVEYAQALDFARQRIGRTLAENRMTKVQFTLDAVEEIPVNRHTGKFELVIPAKTLGQ